jgi:hypothetical protein
VGKAFNASHLTSTFSKIGIPFRELAGIPRLISYVGKLGFKEEAAGKMRVFAMVDPITQ